jgi:lysophospholipase L1-like esterase
MFKSPRSRKNYASSLDYTYKKGKGRPKLSLWWLILALPLSILFLELLAQVYVNFAGRDKIALPSSSAYRLKFLTETNQTIGGLANQGNLAVRRSPIAAYQLREKQRHDFWQINEQGFRDSQPLPLAKPPGEIRIFVLGGSVAFGQGLANNEETISHQLESRLQQRVIQQQQSPEKYRPDVFPFFQPSREKLLALPAKIRLGKYRVINAAVPGYMSGNELAQFVGKILPYQPDFIVVFNGYGDLMLSSDHQQADIPKIDEFLHNPAAQFQANFSQSFHQRLQGMALARTLNAWLFKSQPSIAESSLTLNLEAHSLASYLPENEAELNQRVARYRNNYAQLIRLATAAGIPTAIAQQPEITGLPLAGLSASEKALRDHLGKNYLERVPKYYGKFAEASQQLGKNSSKNIKILNFYTLESNFPSPAFVDAIHLTKAANTALAQKLYQSLTSWEAMQVIPENFYLKK